MWLQFRRGKEIVHAMALRSLQSLALKSKVSHGFLDSPARIATKKANIKAVKSTEFVRIEVEKPSDNKTLNPGAINIYTDGSYDQFKRNAGCGIVIAPDAKRKLELSFNLDGKVKNANDAELLAIERAARFLVDWNLHKHEFAFKSDCQGGLRGIKAFVKQSKSGSSAACNTMEALQDLAQEGNCVHVQWNRRKSHELNIVADRLAKEARKTGKDLAPKAFKLKKKKWKKITIDQVGAFQR